MDVRTIYTDAQTRVLVLLRSLPEGAESRTVAGTPAWTVSELVRHLCGVACDIVAGTVEGAATEPWTARQVAERRDQSTADVLDEWVCATPKLLERLAVPGLADAAAFDMLAHEHDLRGTLGRPGPADTVAVEEVTFRLARSVGRRVDNAGLPGLLLVSDGTELVCGAGDVTVTGRASCMEWFRALMGRRSAGQIATYEWEGDPGPYHGVLNLFGPLPGAPVMEAGAPGR